MHDTHTHNVLTGLVPQSESHIKESVVICLYTPHPLKRFDHPPSISPVLCSFVLMLLGIVASINTALFRPLCVTTMSVWFTNPPVARTSRGS